MTEEEKIAVDKMESERAEEAFRKSNQANFVTTIKNGGKTENINKKRKQVTNLFLFLQILG